MTGSCHNGVVQWWKPGQLNNVLWEAAEQDQVLLCSCDLLHKPEPVDHRPWPKAIYILLVLQLPLLPAHVHTMVWDHCMPTSPVQELPVGGDSRMQLLAPKGGLAVDPIDNLPTDEDRYLRHTGTLLMKEPGFHKSLLCMTFPDHLQLGVGRLEEPLAPEHILRDKLHVCVPQLLVQDGLVLQACTCLVSTSSRWEVLATLQGMHSSPPSACRMTSDCGEYRVSSRAACTMSSCSRCTSASTPAPLSLPGSSGCRASMLGLRSTCVLLCMQKPYTMVRACDPLAAASVHVRNPSQAASHLAALQARHALQQAAGQEAWRALCCAC